MPRVIRLVLMGPPGSGKGTQAKLLEKYYDIPHLSTGDILRHQVSEGTVLGRAAEEAMSQGQLVADQLIIDMVQERLGRADCVRGYILDGFPRTVVQAEALQAYLARRGEELNAALEFWIPDDEIVKRLSGRVQCADCGSGYHGEFHPAQSFGRCDACGGKLVKRDDDAEETIRARLKVFRKETEALCGFYEKLGILRRIAGMGDMEEIFTRVQSAITGNVKVCKRP